MGSLPNLGLSVVNTTASGISSGAFFAIQLLVAFSRTFSGAGAIAGGPYYCAQSSVAIAVSACATAPSLINVKELVQITKNTERTGTIDSLDNLQTSRVYLLSGSKDTVVTSGVVSKLELYLKSFISGNQIAFVNDIPAEHAWLASSYGNACSFLGEPYINNCGVDFAGDALQHMLSGMIPPQLAASVNGTLRSFDQARYLPLLVSLAATSLAKTGYVWIPAACSGGRGGAECRLHVALHGCEQTVADVGMNFINHSGLLEWANANEIVVLFPQAVRSPLVPFNPKGCWDWWGYTTPAYASKLGVQMATVKNMIDALRQGEENVMVSPQPPPPSPLSLRRWGLNVHRWTADSATMSMINAAARITRMDVRWSLVEAQPGRFNFTLYDDWVAELEAANITPYLILDGSNTNVIPATPGCPGGCSPATDEARDKWVSFATATMKHFAGKGIVFELMNEPNGKSWTPQPNASAYAKLALALHAARQRDPTHVLAREVLVGPTLAGLGCWAGGGEVHCAALDFMRELADAGALAAFDAISTHAYVVGAPEQHLSWTSTYNPAQPKHGDWDALDAILADAGLAHTPTISGEWGWSTCGDGVHPSLCDGGASPDASTLRDQAMYLARSWLTNTARNISISIFYDFENGGTNTTLGENNFGVASCSGGPARGCCCSYKSGAGRVCRVCANATASQKSSAWVPKPSHTAAKTLQSMFGTREYLGSLLPIGRNGTMQWALAFGAHLPSPTLPSALAQGIAAGGANVEAIALWNLKLGGESESACAPNATLVGVQNKTRCQGTIFSGHAPGNDRAGCEELCRSTVGCRSFTTWGGDNGTRWCATHYSRCVAPTNWNCGQMGCGEDEATATRAYTLQRANTPAACAAVGMQLKISGAVGRCFARFDMLGGRKKTGGVFRVDAAGNLNVSAVNEEPTYLVEETCA